MAGCHSGATAKIKKVANKNLLSTHCIYRCEQTAAQKLSPELNDIMIRPIKIINWATCDPVLHLRVFEALCVSMAVQNRHLLFNTEVIWLLRGRALPRLFELREEANQFLRE